MATSTVSCSVFDWIVSVCVEERSTAEDPDGWEGLCLFLAEMLRMCFWYKMAASFLGSHTSFLPFAMRLKYAFVIFSLISSAGMGSSCVVLRCAVILEVRSVVAMPRRASIVQFRSLSGIQYF